MSEQIKQEDNFYSSLNENKEEEGNKLKGIVWLFVILLIGSISYTIYSHYEHESIEKYLEQEKLELQSELAKMENQYEGLKIDNESLNVKVIEQQEQISVLKSSVSRMKASVRLLKKYKSLLKKMKSEKRQLFLLADSLDRMNQILVAQRDNAESKLQEQTLMSEKLADENIQLAKVVEKGSVLEISGLKVDGVKVSRSGKMSPTKSAKRVSKIRICMNLNKNNLAKSGDKTVYVRVASPTGDLVGNSDDKVFMVEDEKMNYSAKTDFYYEQTSLDICAFVDADEEGFVKGEYLVAIYVGNYFAGETTLTFK